MVDQQVTHPDPVSGLRLDHIGYAVESIEAYLEGFLLPLLGAGPIGEVVEDPIQRARVLFVALPGGGRLELIEPVDAESPVAGVLKQKRGGLYHLCYAVDDLDGQIERFRQRGCLPISGPSPAAAMGNRRIAFLCTPQFDVVELVEDPELTTGTS